MNLTLLYAATVIAGPLLLLAFWLVPDRVSNPRGRRFAILASRASLVAVGFAGLAVIGRTLAGPLVLSGPFGIGLYFDNLSAIMLLLVSFLGAVVIRFSVNYLAGDPAQGRFIRWLCVTIGAVLTLIVSGNLLMFTIAWVATSLSLHKLLTFYPERPAAMLAAKKKFLISRLGDACLVGALVATWNCFGTWQFTEMFAAADAMRDTGSGSACLTLSALLLVIGALLKSAQFPFHSWLPDTMEAPTPVSALMHAGIINAGGFLVVRLSPVITCSPAALNALALVGAFTALFASVIMLTQTSVKRSLAYSTVAQMGFMMLQCGLGAFSLAILHLVAHSLYKAHAFLSSGSIVSISKSAWTPSERPGAHPVILAATLAAAVGLTLAIGTLFGVHLTGGAGVLLLGSIFIMALAYLLWNLWSSSHRSSLILWGLIIASVTATAYFTLHLVFEKMLAGAMPEYDPNRTPAEYFVMALVGLAFMGVLILQSQLPAWSTTRLGRAFYVHASHGFYLGTIFNRLTVAVSGKSTL
jgi:NAD(P)H-quinone oxidoreductase subunit 5